MPLLNFLSTTLLPLWRQPRRTRSQLLLVSVLTKTAATYSACEHRWSFHGDAQAGCKMPSSTTSPRIPPQGHDRRKQGSQGRQCCCWRADSEIRACRGCWLGWEGTRVLQVWEGGRRAWTYTSRWRWGRNLPRQNSGPNSPAGCSCVGPADLAQSCFRVLCPPQRRNSPAAWQAWS